MRRLVAVLVLIVASIVGWGANSVTVASQIAITDELGSVELVDLSPHLTTVEPAGAGDPSLAAASYESNAAEVIVYAYDTPAVSRVKAGRTRTAEQALPLAVTGEMLTAGGSASIGRTAMTPVVSLVTPSGTPARFIDSGGTIIDRASIRTTVSAQRQGRHVLGDRLYSGGSYFNSADDAQRVLDDFHSGAAEILGIKGNDIVGDCRALR